LFGGNGLPVWLRLIGLKALPPPNEETIADAK